MRIDSINKLGKLILSVKLVVTLRMRTCISPILTVRLISLLLPLTVDTSSSTPLYPSFPPTAPSPHPPATPSPATHFPSSLQLITFPLPISFSYLTNHWNTTQQIVTYPTVLNLVCHFCSLYYKCTIWDVVSLWTLK